MKIARRRDGRISWTIAFNAVALVGALALATFADELAAAPLVSKVLIFVVAVANIGLRFRTTMPLGQRRGEGAGLDAGDFPGLLLDATEKNLRRSYEADVVVDFVAPERPGGPASDD